MNARFASDKSTTCFFAGSQPVSMPWMRTIGSPIFQELFEFTDDAIQEAIDNGYVIFMSGANKGFDMFATNYVVYYRDIELNPIWLLVVKPCYSHTRKWSELQRIDYRYLLDDCDESYYLQAKNSKGLQQKILQLMIEKSSLLITAYHDGDEDSEQVFRQARAANLAVIRFNLTTLKTERYSGIEALTG